MEQTKPISLVWLYQIQLQRFNTDLNSRFKRDLNSNFWMADYTCGGCKYYFDSKTYPVIDDASWKNLTRDLLKACHASGASFYNAGGSKRGCDNRNLRCTHSRLYRNQSSQSPRNAKGLSGRENLEYRLESLQNSKRHARGKAGQTELPKRLATKKALTIDDKCNAAFTIYRDKTGFYFKGGQGPVQHCHHYWHSPELMSAPVQFLDSNEQAILMSMANAHAGNGVCRNVCLERNSIFLSCSKVRHLHGITGNKEKDESTDDGGNLRQQFKDHGVSFCFLYHQLGQYGEVVENKKNQQQGTVVNETYISHSEEEDQPSISAEPLSHEQENENMYGYAMSHREKSSNGVDEHLWIALAYVTPQSRRLFRLYLQKFRSLILQFLPTYEMQRGEGAAIT